MASNASRRIELGARTVLGLIFLVFGLNGFFQFLPQPPMNEQAGAFIMALGATGYFFPLLKGVEVVAAILLLANRAVPLALLLLAPIVVHIAAFHTVLQPGYAMVAVLLTLQCVVAYAHRQRFAPLFAASPRRDAAESVTPAPQATATSIG